MSGTWELAELGKAATSLPCPPTWGQAPPAFPKGAYSTPWTSRPPAGWPWAALLTGAPFWARGQGLCPLFLALSSVPAQCLLSLDPVAGPSGAQTGPARVALTVGMGQCSCAQEGPQAASLES